MEWSEEEVNALTETWANTPPEWTTEQDVLAIASRAVELAAARGGTMMPNMSPEEVEAELRVIGGGKPRGGGLPNSAKKLRFHIAALEAELARLKPSGQVAEDERVLSSVLTTLSSEFKARWMERLSRIAAKAQGYETAVANNAALFRRLRQLSDAFGATAAPARPSAEEYRALAAHVLAQDALTKDHLGAALLEEHRKALEDAQRALESQQAECHTLRRAFLHERHRADAAGAPPEHAFNARWAENLLAEERKALVRARNEGLEKAAHLIDEAWNGDFSGLSSSIRAMKEPEE